MTEDYRAPHPACQHCRGMGEILATAPGRLAPDLKALAGEYAQVVESPHLPDPDRALRMRCPCTFPIPRLIGFERRERDDAADVVLRYGASLRRFDI